jgi:hypothetical protein
MRIAALTALVGLTLVVAAWWLAVELRAGSRRMEPLADKPSIADRARQELFRHDPFVLVLCAVAVIWAFAFVLGGSPVKGLADNGDWERLMYQLNLAPAANDPLTSGHLNQYMLHVSSRSALPIPASVAASNSQFSFYFGYLSSQLGMIKIALLLHALSGSPLIDIRWIGFVNLVPLVFGVGAFVVVSRRFRPLVRRVLVVLVVAAFFDPGYLLYLNSMYSEPATIGFLVLAAGAAFAVVRCRRPGLAFWVFVLATSCFALAKSDNAVAALPFAIVVVFLAGRAYGGGWASPGRQLAASLGVAAVLGTAVWNLTSGLEYFTRIHEYDAVFVGLLPHASNKLAVLRALGLPSRLVVYSGHAAFDRQYSAFALPSIQNDFFVHMSMGKIALYYLGHPGALWAAINYGSGEAPTLHLNYLSNVTTGPAYVSHTPWSAVHDARLPHNPAILLAPLAAVVLAGRRLFRPFGLAREMSMVFAALGLGAIISFVQAPMLEGTEELTKHELLFNVCFDLCFIGLITLGVSWLTARFSLMAGFDDIGPTFDDIGRTPAETGAAESDPVAKVESSVQPEPAAEARTEPAAVEPTIPTARAEDADPRPLVATEPESGTRAGAFAGSALRGKAQILCPVCDATVPLDPFVDNRGRRVTACPECDNAIVLADRVPR